MGYRSTDVKNIIGEIIEDKKEKEGVKSLYFVGCGGSLGALYPAKTFMETESADIKCALISSNELYIAHRRILVRILSSAFPVIKETHRKQLQLQSLVKRWALPLSFLHGWQSLKS